MARSRGKRGMIRPSAVRVWVYNEGLCVYLHDEGTGERLREMMGSKSMRGVSADKTFIENLSVRAFGLAVSRERLAVAYTLEQDDEVNVEVGVGPALTEGELAAARWLKPQYARLDLPTGRLRIDTANTMPLDPDEKQDAGGTVTVPSGDYLLTLYRVDYDAMRREGVRGYKGPDEFLLLTPTAEAPRVKTGGPILPFVPAKGPAAGTARPAAGGELACKLCFPEYWSRFICNIDRKAADKLKLQPGSRMQFQIDKLRIEGLFVGDSNAADYTQFIGASRVETMAKAYSEFAIGGFGTFDKKECLIFARTQAKKCAPEKWIDRWTPATGRITAETWPMPGSAAAAKPEHKAAALHATVAFAADEIVLNITRADLQALGAADGELLRLECGREHRTIVWVADHYARSLYVVVTPDLPATRVPVYQQMATLSTPMRYFTLSNRSGVRRFTGSLPTTALPANDAWPLAGTLMNDPAGGAEPLLRMAPFSMDGEPPEAIPWSAGLPAGAQVIVRRQKDG